MKNLKLGLIKRLSFKQQVLRAASISVFCIMLILSSSGLHSQDLYNETYKSITTAINTGNFSSKNVGYVTLASIGIPSSQSLDQMGFYGFGRLQLEEPSKNSLVGKTRIYASKYKYKNVLDLTPTEDLFPLNQALYEYNLQLFPSGKVSYQFLINGKPFLNRPPEVVQAYSFRNGYVQAGPLVMYIKVGNIFPPFPKNDIEIEYTPLVNFQTLRRPNASGGTSALFVGEDRIATVYRVDRITNTSNKDYILHYKNFRSVSSQASDAYFGSGSSGTVLYLVNNIIPGYFAKPANSITIPKNKTIELQSSRIVIVYPSNQKEIPLNLYYSEAVKFKPVQNNSFEFIQSMDIDRFKNFP